MFDAITIKWSEIDSIPEVGVLLVGLAVAGYVVWYMFMRKRDETKENDIKDIIRNYQISIDSYKERLETVENETKTCHEQHKESIKQLGEVRGRLDVVENIPLKDIAKSMKEIQRESKEVLKTVSDIVKTQRDIIKLMNGGK